MFSQTPLFYWLRCVSEFGRMTRPISDKPIQVLTLVLRPLSLECDPRYRYFITLYILRVATDRRHWHHSVLIVQLVNCGLGLVLSWSVRSDLDPGFVFNIVNCVSLVRLMTEKPLNA